MGLTWCDGHLHKVGDPVWRDLKGGKCLGLLGHPPRLPRAGDGLDLVPEPISLQGRQDLEKVQPLRGSVARTPVVRHVVHEVGVVEGDRPHLGDAELWPLGDLDVVDVDLEEQVLVPRDNIL